MRHKWTDTFKHYGGETSTCAACGMKRHRRHAGRTHWTEWQRPDGQYIDSDRTPPCEGSPAEQAHALDTADTNFVSWLSGQE